MDRRETLAWLARALALGLGSPAWGLSPLADAPPAEGYGRDPNLAEPAVPWALTLTRDERASVVRLVDLMLPADAHSPAASTLGVAEFVDEWISAPYPIQQADRRCLLDGLRWLDARTPHRFVELEDDAARRILDAICDPSRAPALEPARFFARLRQICLIGYYTTAVGAAELGYVGNQVSRQFDGPPPEVLARLGV
jgi:hypothetical protein